MLTPSEEAAFRRGWCDYRHEVAVGRIRGALERRLERAPDPDHWLWDIVGPMRSRLRLYREVPPLGMRLPEVPFGWVEVRLLDRCASRILPCWIAWPYLAWVYRWRVLEPLVRLGLVRLDDDAYWHTARPWFWTAEREASFRAMLRGLPN